MGRVIQFTIFALVVFAIIAYVVPWAKDTVRGISADSITGKTYGGDSEAAYCVQLAYDANRYIAREVRLFSNPTVDPGSFAETMIDMRDRLLEAEDGCRCGTEACDTALQALTTMSSMLDSLDAVLAGDGRYVTELARNQERVDTLLQQARAAQ